MNNERILCAAIYVDTGKAEPARRSHSYPETGLVFSGWRHGDCLTTLNAWSDLLSEEERYACNLRDLQRVSLQGLKPAEAAPRAMRAFVRGVDQGFLTSTGRYVGRKEAAAIALAAGQILRPEQQGTMERLYSEDLY